MTTASQEGPMDEHSQQPLLDFFAAESYLRERQQPQPQDQYFLHLKDLLEALRGVAHDRKELVLDFGAGNSPYTSLFPNAEYRRADITAVPGLHYAIREDGTVDERDNTFDLVLSTQVLEHIEEPQKYLREAFRLLKPGGRIVVTTHGVWEDHGCPYDFMRWTADGLTSEVRRAGFTVEKCQKLTTQMRFLIFQAGQLFPSCGFFNKKQPFSFHAVALELITRYFRHYRTGVHAFVDRVTPGQGVVDASNANFKTYLGLLVQGTKPER